MNRLLLQMFILFMAFMIPGPAAFLKHMPKLVV